ncbi:unnamed protein product, partial [Polarella glacialis]
VLPELRLKVSEHGEEGGHTYYLLECSILGPTSLGAPCLKWSVRKRLVHLRSGLHDAVKSGLGQSEYERHFASAPFARYLGMPGTTARLRKWCQTLAVCMNMGIVRPAHLASILQFLEATKQPAECA